jgi:two-component system OmpR family response regulator
MVHPSRQSACTLGGCWAKTRRRNMILIVDDHQDTCEAMKRLLARKGLSAQFVLSGDEALEFCKRTKPDVVVLDDMMPGKSGLEVFHDFLKDPNMAGTKVIFYSAIFDFKKSQEAERMGARAWMVKGTIHINEVINRIAMLQES